MISDLQIRTLSNRIQRKAPLRYREGLFDLIANYFFNTRNNNLLFIAELTLVV